MSIGGFKIRNQCETHFMTFTVVEWLDVFTRMEYRNILLDSIRFCQANKNLLLHAWCLMSNHIHMIGSSKEAKLSDILRDLKKYTGRQIIQALENNARESRKEWMLPIF